MAGLQELAFHSDFPEKQESSNRIILVAANLTAFCSSIGIVSAHSSFFRNLFSLRHLSDGETETPILHLEETSELVLRLLLTLLHREARVDWMAETCAKDGYEALLRLLQDLFVFADKYDFDNIPQLLAWRLPDLPFTLFALATPPPEDSVPTLENAQSSLVHNDPLKLPRNINLLLVTQRPMIIANMFMLQRNRERWRHQLELLIKTEQEFENDSNDFAKGCKPGNGGSKKKACEIYVKFKGRFDRARQATGNAVMDNLQQSLPGSVSITGRLRAVIEHELECRICSGRMIRMVRRCISKLNKQGWEIEGSQDTTPQMQQGEAQGYLDWMTTIIDVRRQISELSQGPLHQLGKLSIVPHITDITPSKGLGMSVSYLSKAAKESSGRSFLCADQ